MQNYIENYSRTLSQSTSLAYSRDLLYFKDFFENRELTEKNVSQYIQKLKKDKSISDRTVKRRTTSTRMFINYLKSEEVITFDLSSLPDTKGIDEAPLYYINDDILKAIIDNNVKWNSCSSLHVSLILMIRETGIKKNKLLNLKLSDVFKNGGMFFLKCSNEVIYPLSLQLSVYLNKYIDEMQASGRLSQKSHFLFQAMNLRKNMSDNKSLNPKTINDIIFNAKENAGIKEDITPQVLRNTYLKNIFERSDLNLEQKKKLTGLKSNQSIRNISRLLIRLS